jgi:hypothetical protein
LADPSDAAAVCPSAEEELWLDIFEAMVRGGQLPDAARSRVALASGRGTVFADAIYVRWAARVDELLQSAVRSAE